MSDDFDKYLEEALQDPSFRAAYEDAETLSALVASLTRAREAAEMTQKDLAEKAEMSVTRVHRIDSRDIDPDLSDLQRYARALGKRIDMKIVSSRSRERAARAQR